MTFDDILKQVIALLKRQGRVSYGALKMRFEEIDDKYLDVLKEELFFAYPVTDENERGLVWNGETETTPEPTSQSDQTTPPDTQITQPIPVEPTPDEPYTPDTAERRQLTVMFCDLVGSTELSGQMDAEEYRDVVRAYQTTCGDVIERFGCHIAQTLGDGLLVYSGYPVAHENDAERAVRTGLGILDALRDLNASLGKDKGIHLAVRIGIHTGQVVVGEMGAGARQEQLALGETPNIAARIQGLAEPDTIVISDATYRLIQGYFECETLGEQSLRGVAEPVVVHRVVSESGAQSRLDIVSSRGLTPLVGRESESTLLVERWTQAEDGQGQVVLLSGEAGIGKSRLVQVLKDHIADEAHTRLECRSSPYFTNSALYPIIDLLQRTLQFQTDDKPVQRLGRLEQTLEQYRLPLEETVPLFAALLSLTVPEDRYPPLNLTPQRQRQKTLESIITILLEQAERQPLLFIVEDVHWLDASTNELLDHLIDQVPTASLLILITYRPEFQPTWSNRSYLTPVILNRLSRDDIEQMVARVTREKPLPDEVIQQLVDKTDGVPLYVEEMTKAVLESGLLKDVDGQYELTGPVSSLSIPTTLQDSLMARLDRLVTAKGIAQMGATIGRQFSYELLHAVSEVEEETLQKELNRLVQAELVYQRGLLPQATYVFKHALIQDAAYGSLLRNTRQGYHRRIAEVLEKRFPETAENQPELLAHHYTKAGLSELAVEYWYKAGQLAIERSAHAEAISHLTQGLQLLAHLPHTAEHIQHELRLQTALAAPLHMTKGHASPEVEHIYARARELCQQVTDKAEVFPVLFGLWRFYTPRAEHTTARALGEQLLSLAQDMPNQHRLLAHYASGVTCFWQGAFSEAERYFKQGMTLYEPHVPRSLPFRSG